jgi:isopentenyl diphosphate isomerase/L-lactate dehydrogenase-like FMN-dependent dehydrogenase
MAYQHFAHAEAEVATGRAAARAGALFCLSTMSSRSLEEVAAAADEAGGGPRWFQLYVHRDRALAADLVARAEAAGFGAVALTVDLPIAGVRERDTRNRFDYPQQFGNFGRPEQVSAVIGGFNDASLSWADLPWLRGLSQLPLVVKGILTAEDAVLAVENGAAGVVVSNHGGRQLDRVPASIDVLREAEVYLDGGVRRAVDVLTALALGARGVFIGRPFGYALAVGGEAGVARALELIGDELRTDMALMGVTAVEEVGPGHVRRASLAGG